MSQKRFTITSALLYANGPIHLGHLSGAYLPADIFSRYQKLKGHDVLFVSGSDEHGAAITLQAKKENISPKEIIDKYHDLNKKSFEEFGIEFSIYHRTSSELHHKTSQDFFLKLNENNEFVKKDSYQFYDDENQQFLADRYIIGECPKCGFEEAYGDQCESCGSSLSPEDLISPKSTLSGISPVKRKTFHWYLQMQNHEKWLKEWIEKGTLQSSFHHDPKMWKKQVLGQCKSWINSGLKERSMTRDLDWGVKVPLEDATGKVLYVWLDAPIGYISATKQWCLDHNKNWEDYWKKEKSEIIHFIGKDNIVFHCIIFPILLKSHAEYNLPKNIPANEFLNLEGKKLSTSKNWAIWLHEYLKEFPNQQDSLRYTLCSTTPENKDTDFTWKDFQSRNNNELASILGNFINRVIILTYKYWGGNIPERDNVTEYDQQIINSIQEYPNKIGNLINEYKFKESLSELMNLSRMGNKYLADTEPWKLRSTDERQTKNILNICLQICCSISILCKPFLPFTSKKLEEMLNIKGLKWDDAANLNMQEGNKIKKIPLLFEKIEDDQINEQLSKLSL